ncbi:hypothetical protein J3E64_000849 [Sphingobium sp. OAS761]|uniref:DUF2218 domain-containing protein n=1 Tax=Sphingobium sp. OAS761 TaxID=2817901 RepID=UPI00209FFE0B|nr:DUF2218 domain-containing protein [Sphingobium sp. OAS761]MCP1469178.1 hypothetical protein [Sphingobium sp. OAS761]
MITHGRAHTASADRYIRQLVKHWGHKFATSYADGRGTVPFSAETQATFDAKDGGIAITLVTADTASAEQMKEVIASHLNRFAFREGELAFEWSGA